MTDMRKKISEHIRGFYHGTSDLTLVETADAIIAALPDMVPELEWREASCGKGVIAFSVGRQYAAWDDEDPRWALSLGSGYKYIYVDSFEAAKAAANIHNRTTLMAALGIDVKGGDA